MAWFLRKVRWNRWQDRVHDLTAAFTAVSPDPLGDVSTTQRRLSLWQLDDDRENLDRIVALLAATVQAPAECAFIIFSADRLSELELRALQNDGNSPDAMANVTWHFDLEVRSAEHLVRLARFLLCEGEIQRRNPGAVKKLLQDGIQKRELDPDKMDARLREKLRLA